MSQVAAQKTQEKDFIKGDGERPIKMTDIVRLKNMRNIGVMAQQVEGVEEKEQANDRGNA